MKNVAGFGFKSYICQTKKLNYMAKKKDSNMN